MPKKTKKKRATKRSPTSTTRRLEAAHAAGARRGRAGGPWLPEHYRLDLYEQGVEVHRLGNAEYRALQGAHYAGHGLAQRSASSRSTPRKAAKKAPKKAAKKAPKKAAKKAPRKARKAAKKAPKKAAKKLTGSAFARRMAAARAAKRKA